MASDRKIAEGNACIREAEKYLKTSFLKWRPDYDSAANEYSKAATNFRTARVLDQCNDCLLKAAECYYQNRSYFSAAKSYEQSALICKEMEDYMGAVKMVERACELFREHGTPDTAAIALEKGAKMVESKYPEIALELYNKAAEVVMIEDRPRQAAEYTGKVSRLLVKLKRYDDAAEMLKKEVQYHLMSENHRAAGRLVIAQVLVHLIREDYVAADKAFKEGYSFVEKEEANTAMEILEGFDQGDVEQMNRGLSHPFITHMDVEYARLARSLLGTVEQSSGLGSHSGTPAKSSASRDLSGQDDDDEFSGGLL